MNPRSSIVYFPHVDALRAFSVVAVLLFHLQGEWLPGGFSGVDIFFVISGYIVSASVGSLPHPSLARFSLAFYARRFQRILPALLVCVSLVTLLGAIFIAYVGMDNFTHQAGIYALFGFSNLVLIWSQDDYFSPVSELNPYTHTWSLGVEEQFYLVFPLLFYLWLRGGHGRRGSALLFLLALIASIAYAAYLRPLDHTAAYYLIFTRFWELAAGVLLYQGMVARGESFSAPRIRRSPARALSGWVGLGLLSLGLWVSEPTAYPFPGALLPVCGALLFLWSLHGLADRHLIVRLVNLRPVLFIGKASYSLYLWHWPIYVLFRWTLGLESWWTMGAALLLTLVFSLLSYFYVERLFRYLPEGQPRVLSLRRWGRVALVVALGYGLSHLKPNLASLCMVALGALGYWLCLAAARLGSRAGLCNVLQGLYLIYAAYWGVYLGALTLQQSPPAVLHWGLALLLAGVLMLLSVRLQAPVASAQWRDQRVILVGLLAISAALWLCKSINANRGDLAWSQVAQAEQDWYTYVLKPSGDFQGYKVDSIQHPVVGGQAFTELRCAGAACPTPTRRIFAMGDSHTLVYLRMLRMYVMKTGNPVFVYPNGVCPFLNLMSPSKEETPMCQANLQAGYADLLARIQPGDVLFLASLRTPRFALNWMRIPDAQMHEDMFGAQAVRGREIATARADSLLQPLRDKGVIIVMEAPSLLLKYPPFRCTEIYNRSNPICRDGPDIRRQELEDLRAPVMAIFQRLGVRVWDPFPILCPAGEWCRPTREGRPLMVDGDHMSGYATEVLFPDFLAFIQALPEHAP